MVTKKQLLFIAFLACTVLPAPNCRNLGGAGGGGGGGVGETLTGIFPPTVATGSPATIITLTGTNFVAGSTANWNGTALVTTFVSATSLTAVIPAADLTTAGPFSVTVDSTSAVTFTVGGGGGGLTVPPPGTAQWIIDFMAQVQTYRGANGQALLFWDNNLGAAAQSFANDMNANALTPNGGPTGGIPGISDPANGDTITSLYFTAAGSAINAGYDVQTWSGAGANGATFAQGLGQGWWIFFQPFFNSVGNPPRFSRIGVGYNNGYAVVLATP